MKRGLKGSDRNLKALLVDYVAEYSPMKRGLKEGFAVFPDFATGCCRVFPDEEGTESSICTSGQCQAGIVAEYSPMKRGLKAMLAAADPRGIPRCRVFPDEEGTERLADCSVRSRTHPLQSIPR